MAADIQSNAEFDVSHIKPFNDDSDFDWGHSAQVKST